MTDEQIEGLIARIIQRLAGSGRDYTIIGLAGCVACGAVAGGTAAVSRRLAGADLLNGTLQSLVARRKHDALLAGIPVLALRYLCDPHSELNQLRGTQADCAYAGHLLATLDCLEACGVFIGTMNAPKLEAPAVPAAASSEPRRYLTIADVVNNPALAAAPHAQLTDAAIDF